MTGDDNDWKIDRAFGDFLQQFEPVHPRHTYINDQTAAHRHRLIQEGFGR